MKRLYIFDFDHTIYDGDSMLDFAKYVSKKKMVFSLVILAVPILVYKIGFLKSSILKSWFLRINFKGFSEKQLIDKSKEFFKANRFKIKNSFDVFLLNLDFKNTDCYIVSASSSLWLESFYKHYKMNFIGTEIEVKSGLVTGRLASKNIKGSEKVKAVKDKLKLEIYSEIHCFGDAKSDKKMKQISTHYYSNYFK